ncbi:MAG TPA: hypothetical protein VFB59_03270 [Candidatus Saccharimonadales bacterium]|nr:hypothetical protein [Candidatus Saccharimonadales bacterium]
MPHEALASNEGRRPCQFDKIGGICLLEGCPGMQSDIGFSGDPVRLVGGGIAAGLGMYEWCGATRANVPDEVIEFAEQTGQSRYGGARKLKSCTPE